MLRFENEGVTISVKLPETDYVVYIMSVFNKVNDTFATRLFLTRNDTSDLSEIECDAKFSGNVRNIKFEMASYITHKFNSGFFNYYIERYEYQQSCLEDGIRITEDRKSHGV